MLNLRFFYVQYCRADRLSTRTSGSILIAIDSTFYSAPCQFVQLKAACSGIENVALLPLVSRSASVDAYREADVLFLHLNDYEVFKKVLPSKIFEYAALGKPILAGVGGYAAEFLREHVSNAEVFDPGDVSGAVASFERLNMREEPRTDFISRFARAQIMNEMADDIVSFMQGFERNLMRGAQHG